VDAALNTWFAREILPHEAALVRYLTRIWPHPDEVRDLCQETYVRVYEAAAKARPQFPKSFLFTTARHLMADRVRRARVVSIETIGDLEELSVPAEEATPEQRLEARQELMKLARAFSALPPGAVKSYGCGASTICHRRRSRAGCRSVRKRWRVIS